MTRNWSHEDLRLEELDDAIDAAIAAEKEHK